MLSFRFIEEGKLFIKKSSFEEFNAAVYFKTFWQPWEGYEVWFLRIILWFSFFSDYETFRKTTHKFFFPW